MPPLALLAAGLLLVLLILRAREEGFDLPQLFPAAEPIELPPISEVFPVDPSTAYPWEEPSPTTERQSWPTVWNAPQVGTYPGGHNEFDNQILYACNLYEMQDALAPLLVKAIIRHESGWNVYAAGDAQTGVPAYRGDTRFTNRCSIGLMQVNRCAHPTLAARLDLRDPNQNILAGAELLSIEYQKYWPNWERVMVGYNGPALAARGTSSNAYSRAVAANFRTFANALGVTV